MSFWKLAERQILKAEAEGQFRKLKGAGKPLAPSDPGGADAVGYRIMAEAGAIPKEISLKKAIEAQRAVLASMTSDADRKAAMAKLAELEMRHAIECEARRASSRHA